MKKIGILVLLGLVGSLSAWADPPQLQAIKVADQIQVLHGEGGNVILSHGPDGVFLVDMPYETLFNGTGVSINDLADQDVKFIVNTHWHGDHNGGLAVFGRQGTVIIAHENVHRRLSHPQYNPIFDYATPAAPESARPTLTYTREITLHLNGQTIQALHVNAAHTDGDSVVFFKEADVVHTGDLFMSDSYPVVDTASGGSMDGLITAVAMILNRVGDQTRIVPGHGPVSDKAGLARYLKMLEAVRQSMRTLTAAGKTLDQIKAADPLAPHHADWGGGIVPGDFFLASIYPDFLAHPTNKQ